VRSRLVVVAAAVVAVAVAGALVIRWVDDGDARVTGGQRVEPGACPAVSSDERDHFSLPEPLPGEPDSIAAGAVRVWMCQGPGTPLDVPRDALSTGVDDVAVIIDDLPLLREEEEIGCADDGGPGYRLRFQYADGSVADAVGQMYGCGMVQVGTTLHVGDREWTPAREFVRLLGEQREAITAPTPPEQPTCTVDDQTVYGPVSPVGRAEEMVAAVLCAWDGRGVSGPPDHAAPIPADDLAALMADHAANRSDAHPTGRECRAGRQLSIQGLTAWGDRVVMDGFCSVFRDVTTRPQEESSDYWRPGPEARAILDRLLGTSPVSVAACPSGPDAPLDAEEPDREPGTIPPGASSVRLCLGPGLGFQEPADALVTDVEALAGVINDLDPLDGTGGCTGEVGRGYRLVFTYPDGTATDAVGRLYGCRDVAVDGVARAGSEAPWDHVLNALRMQRTTTKAPGGGFGPTCRGPRSGQREQDSPVALPSEMTAAVLCVMEAGTSEALRRSRIQKEELQMLLADRAGHSDEGEPTDADCADDGREFSLRGVTPWGDRVRMEGFCGMIYDPGLLTGDETTYWHPGPDARAILDRLYDDAEPLRRLSQD
jgi:hypothetical protein